MMSNHLIGKTWTLHKYARFTKDGDSSRTCPTGGDEKASSATEGQSQSQWNWKYYDNMKDDLSVTITGSVHLVIRQGVEILESHSLWNARSWMRGICKGDSLLFVYKIQNESRRFRVKFQETAISSGAASCQECTKDLSQYIFIKHPEAQKGEEGAEPSKEDQLQGSVPIGKLAEVLTGQLSAELPLAYKNSNISTEQLGTFMRLCLSDSNFPAFVGEVEKELNKIIKDSEDT